MKIIKAAALVSLILIAGCFRKPVEWRDVHVMEGGFTVSMPGTPQRTEEQKASNYRMIVYQSVSDSRHMFAAGTVEESDQVNLEVDAQSAQRQILEEGEKRILSSMGGEVLLREDVSLPGIPGKRLVLRMKTSKKKPKVLDFCFYVKDFKLIQLMVESRVKNHLEDPQIDRFYKSFRFNEVPK